jgi:hypothetical protein
MVVVDMRMERSKAELLGEWGPEAAEIAKIPGMRWKFWTFEEAEGAYAGVYLFESLAAARRFLEGPVMQGVRDDPKVRDVRARAYEVLEDVSRMTRAPLRVEAP